MRLSESTLKKSESSFISRKRIRLCVIPWKRWFLASCKHLPNVIPFLTESVRQSFGLDAVQTASLTPDGGCINHQPISAATADPPQLWGACCTEAAHVHPTFITLLYPAFLLGWADKYNLLDEVRAKVQVLKQATKNGAPPISPFFSLESHLFHPFITSLFYSHSLPASVYLLRPVPVSKLVFV